jgi:hypothetical protein
MFSFQDAALTAEHAAHDRGESAPIIVFAFVESEDFFVKVRLEMERSNGNVSAAKHSLSERPKILNAVDMNQPSNVCRRVIYFLVDEASEQASVGCAGVRANDCVWVNIFRDDRQDVFLFGAANVSSENLRRFILNCPLKQAVNDGFADATAPEDALCPLLGVHVLGASADEGFVAFDYPVQFSKSRGFALPTGFGAT